MKRTYDPQGIVYSAVEDRGYVKGWSLKVFFIRQVVKLVEEIAELCSHVRYEGPVDELLLDVMKLGLRAHRLFDDKSLWDREMAIVVADSLCEELADAQVVLFCAAETFSRMENEEFDIIKSAASKAIGDITRGVRGAETD